MEIKQNRNQLLSLFLKIKFLSAIFLMFFFSWNSFGQCLSSVSPVGGTDNLLVQEKNTLRIISFYKYGQGTQYYEKNKHSDFDLIRKAYYNYLSTIVGYGITNKLTAELETGYFFNKTQIYDLVPEYRLSGMGLSNFVLTGKHSLFSEPVKRIYLTGAAGIKIPSSRNPQLVNNVEIPVEVQPTIGACGFVANLTFVKENSESGMRYFIISRMESNAENKKNYKLGNSFFNSVYVSKHLMFPWLKGDWTTIFQLRNEIRGYDKINGNKKSSSGSFLFFVAPQVNYVLNETWNISAMLDIPFYQNFNGTQLGAGPGLTFVFSRTFKL
jgi:hypothetical protein